MACCSLAGILTIARTEIISDPPIELALWDCLKWDRPAVFEKWKREGLVRRHRISFQSLVKYFIVRNAFRSLIGHYGPSIPWRGCSESQHHCSLRCAVEKYPHLQGLSVWKLLLQVWLLRIYFCVLRHRLPNWIR